MYKSPRPSPRKKKCKKAKGLSEEALTKSYGKKRSKRQRGKGKIIPFECSAPKHSEERLKKKP